MSESPSDPKEQMRQALERKKQATGDHGTGAGPAKGAAGKPDSHAQGGKREFRRKSG